ncbi:heparinase II/III-like protein [Kribbella amoyensis]|uniref:Heparinase II/III-like protein n=1 Tax=Kribbella amoyensis TaxID=996641 RepID=A0A561B8P5_9ACTN|nr:heparinase II/III family protein [Kribbella amoyensis]TWD75335.1 heparinase II/III-like protein [Kribbella amoyensis]
MTHEPPLSRRTVLRGSVLAGAAAAVPSWTVLGTATSAAAAGLPATPAAGPVKTATTYYTAERVRAARENVARYAWAQQLRDTAVTGADRLLGKGDDWIWSAVTTQGLPRSYAVNQLLGSPITGTDIYEFGNYPWRADPYGRPWKLVDPSSDYVFPTNDFWAFYQSGLDEHGNFDRDRGDPQYLVNTLYPERGPDWGVEDGFGWIDADGNKWTFAAYYNHWFAWYGPTSVVGHLATLRDAYLLTGDLRHAHAGLVMLDRIADVYPAMDTAPYPRSEGYLHSDGLTGLGKVIGSIWETSLIRDVAAAYDAFFPAIATTDEAGVVPFLAAKATGYGLPAKDSPAAIRANIETGVLRQIEPAVRAAKIRGNFGMHQSTLAMAAVVLDDPVASPQWIDFVFQPGEFINTPTRKEITGGDVSGTLVDDVDRDGNGNEAAPHYNDLWIDQVKGIADILAGYSRYPTADLYAHPKFAMMHRARLAPTMLNRYVPPIGDSGSTGNPGLLGTARDHVRAFERYQRPEDAQAAYLLNGNSADGLYGDLYSTDVAGTAEKIQQIVEHTGPLALKSHNHTGYGFAALRDGSDAQGRAASLYYGRTAGHGHKDTLNLGLWAFGVDLLPDLGYPEFADRSNRRAEWNGNTIAHNTVVVDASPQKPNIVGLPMGFADGENVKFADVAAPAVYSQASLYRRATALIRVDAQNAYAVDVFRVAGGNQHHFSLHAAEGPVTSTGLDLVAQPTGTYAGPTIQQPPDTAPARPTANGFDWLGNVSRATAPAPGFTLDYAVKDTWNVHPTDPDLHLRATLLTEFEEVALADGVPPRNKPGNPKSLRYLIGRRRGTNLASQFVTVFEPYVGTPVISRISRVPVTSDDGTWAEHEVAAVKVELANGRTDYVIGSLRTDLTFRVDGQFTFRGSFGVLAVRQGRGEFAFSHGSTLLNPGLPAPGAAAAMTAPAPALTGTVQDFTRELSSTNRLVLTLPAKPPAGTIAGLAGQYVYVDNDGVRNAVYRIVGARESGGRTVELDLGETTLIRSYLGTDPDAGYRYDVAVGAAARIPVTRQWRA